MPIVDVSYLNASLDAVVDAWPASGATYRYWLSDPTVATLPTDVEVDVTTAGLSNAAFDPADWAAAASGAKTTTAAVALGTSTTSLDDTITYWGIVDGTGLIVFYDFLDDPISVEDAGTVVDFSPSLSFGDV